MAGINGTVIVSILTVILGGGAVKGFLDFLTARRAQRIDYSSTVHKTLVEFNVQLSDDVKELREELDRERERRIKVEEELATERRKTRDLEARVSRLERERSGE